MPTASESSGSNTMPHRSIVLLAVCGAALLAVLGLRHIQKRVATLVELAEQQPDAAEQGLLELARTSLAIPSALLAVGGLLMARLAWRAWQVETFPPPGAWLLRETVPATGAAARRRALAALLIAVLTVTLAAWLPREVLDRLHAAIERAREQRVDIEWSQPEPAPAQAPSG